MDVQETEYCVGRGWRGDVYAEGIPFEPARQLHAEDAVDHQLARSLALVVEKWRAKMLIGEQRHGCKWYALEGRIVLSVGRQKSRAYSGIVEERLSGAGSDFLEMNNVGRRWSRQNVIENELGTCFEGR